VVVTSMRAEYALPWYLRFLQNTAQSVLTRSYTDEIQATVHQLCVAPGQPLTPAPPPVVVAPLLPLSAYFTR